MTKTLKISSFIDCVLHGGGGGGTGGAEDFFRRVPYNVWNGKKGGMVKNF